MRKKKKIRDKYRKSGKMKRRSKMKSSGSVKNKIKEKTELELRQEEKGCYGTSEFSEIGICKPCKWKDDCRKVKNKQKSKTVVVPVRFVI